MKKGNLNLTAQTIFHLKVKEQQKKKLKSKKRKSQAIAKCTVLKESTESNHIEKDKNGEERKACAFKES